MISGKVNAAVCFLSGTEAKGIHPINDGNKIIFKQKHPLGAEKFDDLLLQGPEEFYFW